MRHTLRLATASINTTPLDIDGNTRLIIDAIKQAHQQHAELLLLPELSITGYGCEDMFFAADWVAEAVQQLALIQAQIPTGMLVAVGLPIMLPGGQVFNGVALLNHQSVLGVVCKQVLARSGIHYEPRWFTPWPAGEVVELQLAEQRVPVGDLVFSVNGVRIGFEVCEDSWVASRPGRSLYQRQVDVILNPSASHFAIGKDKTRRQFVKEGSRAFGVVYAYANLVGCEAGRVVYDGGNMIASNGELVMVASPLSFAAVSVDSALVDLQANRAQRMISSQLQTPAQERGVIDVTMPWPESAADMPFSPVDETPLLTTEEAVCRTIALGLWDWQRKTYTRGFAVSLSGGADSALCATLVYQAQVLALMTLGEGAYRAQLSQCGIEVDAPGEREALQWLRAQVMPQLLSTVYQGSANSGCITESAARTLAAGLGAAHSQWSISELVDGYVARVNALTPDMPMNWASDDLALQNIQARVRSPGIWLLANRQNKLLLATSNLSEASVGYCTMDGDTSGVLAPIGGVSKSLVLQLNRWLMETGFLYADDGQTRLPIKALAEVVDQRPTAELRPVEQTDEADLMPFAVLDAIRRITQVQHISPKGVLNALMRSPLGAQYGRTQLVAWIHRYYGLYCRNQWKRERLAASFHIEADSADPKTYRRFPILSSQLKRELAQLS